MAVQQTYTKGVEFNLRPRSGMISEEPKFSRNGYNFKEWYYFDADTIKHTLSDEAAANFTTEETNLSADWDIINYDITYENVRAGENPSENPKTYTITSDTITFLPAQRTGYTCTWSPTQISSGSYWPVTTTAQWETITYNISYLGLQEGDVNPSDNPRTYTIETEGKTFLPAQRTGYTCTWSPAGFNTGDYGDLSTTASWTLNKYKVIFEQPQQGEGIVQVFSSNTEILSGDEIEYTTNLSVRVTENEGYQVNQIKMNGIDITETKQFTMPAETASIVVTWNDIQGVVYFYPGY